LLLARSARSAPGRVRRLLQLAPLPRESEQPHPGRRLLRPWSNDSVTEGKCQTENHRATTPAAPSCSQNFNSDGPDPLLITMPTCPIGSDDVQPGMFRTAFPASSECLFGFRSPLRLLSRLKISQKFSPPRSLRTLQLFLTTNG